MCLFATQGARAQSNPRNILVVYSFADRKEFSAIDQLKTAMRVAIPWQLNFYVENLEGRRFDDENYEKALAENLRITYRRVKLDLVLANNFPALDFIVRHRDELFPGVPIVFFDVAEDWLAAQKLPPDVTGVTAPVEVGATIDLALHLHPSANTVAVLIDNSPYERYWLGRIRSEIARRQNKLNEVDLVALPPGEVMHRIDQLPLGTIVLFQLSYQETTQPAIEVHELAASIGQRFPTYGIFPWYVINHEGIGGDTFDGYRQIALISEVAKRVLSGEQPDKVPVIRDTRHHIAVDWRSLARWHLSEADFPSGTEFVNRQATPWELYRKYILAALALIICQALLILALLWQRARKRKAEEVLRDSEERFRLLANTTPSLIWMCDARGETTFMNERRFDYTGEDKNSGYGFTWMQYVHPDDLPAIQQNFPASMKTRQPFSSEYRLRRRDGNYCWVFNVASPRFDGHGAFAGFIGSIIDITEQKLAHEALEKISGQLIEAQDRERSRIARELHDDVCQKLALLSVRLEYAHRHPVESPALLEDLRKQSSAIADDVHALSHRLHSTKLDYLGLVAGLRDFSTEFCRQHDVVVEFTHRNVPEHLPNDVALCLFRVAQEAVHNAMKYSQTSRFAIDLTGTEDEVQLEVRDWGAGFEVEKEKRSQGLGLVSMQERMNLVHGKFSIESSPGEGTRVFATVPVEAESEMDADQYPATETPAGMNNG